MAPLVPCGTMSRKPSALIQQEAHPWSSTNTPSTKASARCSASNTCSTGWSRLLPRDEAVDHHYALATLFEIMDVSSRADLKSDVLKDLERQRAQFNSYRGNPSIAEDALDDVIRRIDHAFDGLNKLTGKAGQSLNANEWLMSIRSRISIPGGTCEFDLPAYYAWQQLPAARRRADLNH